MLTAEQRDAILKEFVAREAAGQRLFPGLPSRPSAISIARAMFSVEQLPDGALPIYVRNPPVVHEWREAGGARRLKRFECAGCGLVRWERHASRLELPEELRLRPDGTREREAITCREAAVAEVQNS